MMERTTIIFDEVYHIATNEAGRINLAEAHDSLVTVGAANLVDKRSYIPSGEQVNLS